MPEVPPVLAPGGEGTAEAGVEASDSASGVNMGVACLASLHCSSPRTPEVPGAALAGVATGLAAAGGLLARLRMLLFTKEKEKGGWRREQQPQQQEEAQAQAQAGGVGRKRRSTRTCEGHCPRREEAPIYHIPRQPVDGQRHKEEGGDRRHVL